MPAGLGAAGWININFEAVMGTYLDPSTAGSLWVPILSESLAYTEDKYYSQQIRQQTIDSDVKSGYYHVEGDIVLEADVNYLPYFMHASRHLIAKSGAGPYTYTYTPSTAGSASTAASGNVARTLSCTVNRNGVGFGYAGCVVNTMEWTIEDGVLRVSLGMLGLSETDPVAMGSPAWVAASLFGADAHSVYVAASAAVPTFAAADTSFNGFTANFDYNGEAQNRINALRSAAYISFGKTDAGYTTELDFLTKTEYTNFKNAATRAVKLESLKGGATFTLATEAVQIQFNRSAYDAYEVGLGGMDELIMANVTGHGLGIAGGSAYQIAVKSGVNIA